MPVEWATAICTFYMCMGVSNFCRMVNDFINERGEGEFENSYLVYLQAVEEGVVASLNFSEDEFEYVLDRLVEEGKEEQVLELSSLAFEKFPYSSSILARFCDTLILMGNPDKALEILAAYADSFSAESSIQLLFARANIAKGRFVHARDYFYRALQLSEGAADMADQVCALAQDCIDTGNYTEALYYLRKAERLAPLPFEYQNDYAFCYDRLDEPQKAIDCYNKYLDSNPFNDTVWFNLGTVLARVREFDKAIEAFEYSIALNAGNSSSLYNLAVVYMNLQRFADGARIFEQFVEIDSDVLGRMGLSEAYMRLERFDDALAQLNLVLDAGKDKIGENYDVALCGIEAVNAIQCCRRGDYELFKELFLKLFNNSSTWLTVVYDMLPFLNGEEWFLEFLQNIKK